MGQSAPRDDADPEGRGKPRLGTRLLAAVLDVRPRPLLHPVLWVPLSLAAIAATMVVQNVLGNSSAGRHQGFFLYWDGERHSLQKPPGPLMDGGLGNGGVGLGYSKGPTRWTATVQVQVSPAAAAGPLSAEELSEAAADFAREYSARLGPRQESEPWFRTAWRDLLESGQTAAAVTLPAPLENRVTYWSAASLRWIVTAVAVLSVVLWFISGAQVAAYRRMYLQHESGRCPRCGYDFSAAPEQLCPECGCDHRAIRREAIGALRRARRWPVAGPPGTTVK